MATPELRFVDEYGNTYSDWEEKTLGELVKIKNGKDYKHLEDGEIPVLGTGGVMTYRNDFLYDGESVLIGRKGTIDKPQYITGKFWTVDTLFYTEIKKVNPKFFFCICQNIRWRDYNQATGVPSLTSTVISNIKLYAPSLPEQQKIANLFSLIDEKIENLGEQVSHWKQYKQGLSQQLFTQQLRFVDEDDNQYPDWEEKKLGEICKANSSKISANSIEQIDDGFPVYGASGTIVGKIENPDKIDDYVGIVKDGAGAGRVYYRHKNSSLLGTMQYIQEIENNNLGFIFHYLSSFDFSTYKSGSTIPHIYFKNYSQAKLGVPSLPEQKKIANLLSTVDEKMENLENLENEWKLYKQALMQKMFI